MRTTSPPKPSRTLRWLSLTAILSGPLSAFESGSTGANGAFPPGAVPPGTVGMVLDLRNGVLTYQPGGETAAIPNTPAGGFADGTLNFTSMEVPAGVELAFISHASNPPVCILAQSTITIAGTLNVSGENGQDGGVGGSSGGGKGGPGGFKGGNGELTEIGRSGAGLGPGYGAGGGAGGVSSGDGGSYATLGQRGTTGIRGDLYGQAALLPILGGSGGGGGRGTSTGSVAGGGGGGGGAAKLAADEKVIVTGEIRARGGNGGHGGGGGGSGGAVRVISDEISGPGTINAGAGSGGTGIGGIVNPGGVGGLGRIRLERIVDTFTGPLVGLASEGAPGIVVLPNPPELRFTSVAGEAVAANPGGVFGAVDIVIDQPGTITIELAASRVPVGTTVAVGAKPEIVDEVIAPVDSSALAGTFESSTASVDLTFPQPGLYFLEATVNFTLP